VVQADLGKKQDPVSKITRAKKKKKKTKGLEAWLKWKNTSLANMKP
jgi:hypothetical protein